MDSIDAAARVSFRAVAETWVQTQCVLCGDAGIQPVLEVPHPDAPGGRSRVVRCLGCGLRRLDPRPGPEVLGDYYAAATGYNAFVGRRRSARSQRLWEFLRDGYARPAGAGAMSRVVRPVTRRLARWLFDINVDLAGRRGLRVLEVGSGFGDLLIYLQSRGCSVLGTDLSATAAARGREYGVEVRVGNLADLKLPTASFDVAVLCHSLEHVPDPRVELRELGRVLVPGGRLHLAVPNGGAVRLEQDGVRWDHLSHPFHFWFFDPATLVRLLERHGFRMTEGPWTTTRHHAVSGCWSEARRVGWGRALGRLSRFVAASAGRRDGGDVLRGVAENRG